MGVRRGCGRVSADGLSALHPLVRGPALRAGAAGIKGDNAAKLIARPFVSAMETGPAPVSAASPPGGCWRGQDLGLTREVTGYRRSRLWTVAA